MALGLEDKKAIVAEVTELPKAHCPLLLPILAA